MTIQDIKKQQEAAHTALFDEVRLFWAFSNEQFSEGLKKINHVKGEKLRSIGAGGYLPSANVDKFVQGMARIKKEYNKAIKDGGKQMRKNAILQALNNYECFYTGEIEEAVEELGKGYTYQEVKEVYDENKAEYWETHG